MANTTFSGPLRTENGFEQITIDAYGVATTNFDIDSSGNVTSSGTINSKTKVDNSTFNTGAAVTDTLTVAQSGTIFTINGTEDIVVNMPALSTANVGTTYEFFLTTAVGGAKTVTFVLPGAAVSAFHGAIQLMGGTAANPASDIIGDTLTLPNSTVANARVKLTCITDDGTNSIWKTEVLSTPIATIA
jgi:hypothetical protein